MATTLHMPAAHRSSMDRTATLDQTRSHSTPPFAYDTAHPRSRSSSSASSNPYRQPFSASYFPPHQAAFYQPGSWSTNPLPISAFHPAQFQSGFPGQGGYPQQGYQQSQADFAAWANAYQHMMMASSHAVATPPAATEYLDRQAEGYFDRQYAQQNRIQNTRNEQQGGFNPSKRGPSRVTSRDSVFRSASMPANPPSSIPRSPAAPRALESSFPVATPTTLNPPIVPNEQIPIRRDLDPKAEVWVPPRKLSEGMRRDSEASERSNASSDRENTPNSRSSSPASRPKAVRAATPLYPGPISAAANNSSSSINHSASKPSPLSNSTTPEPEKNRLKNKFFKSGVKEEKDSSKAKHVNASNKGNASRVGTFPSPAESSRSTPPPQTPQPLDSDLSAPSMPFANSLASTSELSLAGTDRTDLTATPSTTSALRGGGLGTAEGENGKKGKRSLFRMKNLSTDNISLSSTVSSASMMIRKMGSIGKLARRNSLMGISRIFKDKPKDEDAPIPEREAKESKKIKKKEKKEKKAKIKSAKAGAAPAEVSRTTIEIERLENAEEERMLAGLSPAAKLARQHTLRSRAEQLEKHVQTGQQAAGRRARGQGGVVLPSIESMTSAVPHFTHTPPTDADPSSPSLTSLGGSTPSVVHVQSRTPTIVHAVRVTAHEYDSSDDTSDEGDTVEDVTMTMNQSRLSEDTDNGRREDEEFKAVWGNAEIDRNAVPKKGILKSTSSYSLDERQSTSRPRSNSAQEGVKLGPGPMADLPPSDPARLDGLETLTLQTVQAESPEATDSAYNPFSPSFSPFSTLESAGNPVGLYSLPTQNTSAPTLSLLPNGIRPLQPRSMTVPAKKKIFWAPECAVYTTYDCATYDRRSEPATCNRLTPELAMAIKQELNAFKLEMPVHPESRIYTHYFA
nr:hypothetical protein L204_02853 [Cryptococcus depauperatus CBS 7855]